VTAGTDSFTGWVTRVVDEHVPDQLSGGAHPGLGPRGRSIDAEFHGLMSIPNLGVRELVAAPKPLKKIGRPPMPGATAPVPAEAKPPTVVKKANTSAHRG
jgi:hypothetical protein